MEQFASGWKRNYYGKGDVIVYRLNRDGRVPAGASPVFGANVLMLLYGDAFWPTYTTGDNTGLIATDSMKNFIQRETMNFDGYDLEGYCRFLATTFLAKYPQVEGIQVSADGDSRTPACRADRPSRPPVPSGRGRASRLSAGGRSSKPCRGCAASGCCAWAAARSRLRARRVHHAARPHEPAAAHVARPRVALHRIRRPGSTAVTRRAGRGRSCATTFASFESGSIQQLIYRIGTAMLADIAVARPRCTSRRTTARGIRLPNAATRSASTPMRGRRTAASGLSLKRQP